MTSVKRVVSRTKSCYILQTNEQTFLLDYPSEIYGNNLSFPSFSKRQRPLKLVLPEFTDDIDYILVTRSDSLGVLFLERDIPIYITEPVFEQILMRFRALSDFAVHYEDEDSPGTSIESCDLERFTRNVRFVRFNEHCEFDSVLVVPQSSGTFIGWTNYLIELEDKKTIYYISSLSSRPRLSPEPADISSDYLIINVDDVPGTLHQIDEFSTYVRHLKFNVAVVPLETTTLSIEIISHVLFLLQEDASVSVYVVSPVFNRLCTTVNIESDWLSRSFSSMKEPFPIRSYRRLFVVDSIADIPGISGPAMVFCHPLEFCLFPPDIFESQEVVSINGAVSEADHHFSLKLELNSKEIISKHLGRIVHNLDPDEYFYIKTSSAHCYLDVDGHDVQVCGDNVYLNGDLEFSDRNSPTKKKMSFLQDECKLSSMFRNNRFFRKDDEYYFPDRNVKITMKNDKVRITSITKRNK